MAFANAGDSFETTAKETAVMLIRSVLNRAAVAIALIALFASTSFANRPAKVKDGRQARAAVQKNRAAKGKSTNVSVRAIRSSKSGKSLQVLSQVRGSNKVEAYNVNKSTGVARQTKTGLLSQSKAQAKAHQKARRERAPNKGSYSGVTKSGLTANGNYKFTSKTDRSQRFFVNPVTGRTVSKEKGQQSKSSSTNAKAPISQTAY